MSRHGAIEQDFGDGTFTFRLGLGEVEELEEKCALGLFLIATKLSPAVRACTLKEISEVLRLGLIGGGMAPVDALAKVRKYVDARPIDENRDIAHAICLAGLMRVHSSEIEAAAVGEPVAVETKDSTSPPSQELQS
jgi:hypothetical protein